MKNDSKNLITHVKSFYVVGHTGIADSRGVIYDFAGPYTIGVGKLAFSPPTRYIQLDPAYCTDQTWDEGISNGCEVYKHRMHNLFCDNCHSHVAKCLNNMGYGNVPIHIGFHPNLFSFGLF